MTRTLVKIVIMLIVFVVTRLVADADTPAAHDAFGTARAGLVEHVLKIDDFEDGDVRASSGLSWIVLADDLLGGASEVRLANVGGAEAGSKGALKVWGRRGGKPFSLVGAWVALEGSGRALDLKAFEGVRLRMKSAVPLQAGFRNGNMNFMAPIETGPEWHTVEIPFTALAPLGKAPEGATFSTAGNQWFGVSTPMIMAGGAAGGEVPASDIVFWIDDVELYGRAEASAEPALGPAPGPVSVLPFTPLASVPTDGWVELATDPEGDASLGTLPDATRLEERPAAADGVVWFRVTLRETPHGRWMGMNLALDVDGDPANGQPWWGKNKEFKFDRIVTAYCFTVAGGCQGMFGIVNADEAAGGNLSGGGREIRFAIDRERRAFIVGVPRAALHLGSGANRLVVAVGSALFFGDDVPGQGAVLVR